MRIHITILMLLCSVFSYSQISKFDLGIRKSLREGLDNMVYDFQQYGQISNQEDAELFTQLFEKDALMFDFINPNYLNNRIGQELSKPVPLFVSDFQSQFKNGFTSFLITDTNLGSAVDYSQLDLSSPEVDLMFNLDVKVDYFQGGEFSNKPILRVTVAFDTLDNQSINFRITNVAKVNSQLTYRKEEREPFFEKQLNYTAFQSWNSLTSVVQGEEYFISTPTLINDLGHKGSLEFIKLIAAPEPHEFSWSFGIGYYETSFILETENYFNTSIREDIDNDRYVHNLTGVDLVDRIKMRMAEVPLTFRYERNLAKGFSLFIKNGLIASYLLQEEYSGSAILSHTGYYPQYDVLLEGLEEYGFVNDRVQEGNSTTVYDRFNEKHFSFSGTLTFGINYETQGGLIIYSGLHGFKNVRGPSKNVVAYDVIPDTESYAGIGASVAGYNFGGYGIQLGVRKRFESKNGLVKFEN